MSEARRIASSGKTLRGAFSESELKVNDRDLERIVDAVVPKHIDAEDAWLEFVGGLSRIYAPQSGMHLFKAAIDATEHQAKREADMQRYIAGCTLWESEDGIPVVPEVYDHFSIPLEQHALDVLAVVSTSPLGESGIELPDVMDDPDFQGLGLKPTMLRVDGQKLDLTQYLVELEDAVIPVTKMERLVGGDELRNYLNEMQREAQKKGEEIPLMERLQMAKAVTDALVLFHKSGYLHRDLKPANIYLQELEDGGYKARFLDCGSAVQFGELPEEKAFIGTFSYSTLEHIYAGWPQEHMQERARARQETDIFCLGEIIHKLFYGLSPVSMALKDEKDKYLAENKDQANGEGLYTAQFIRLTKELLSEDYLAPISERIDNGGTEYLRTPKGIVDNIMYRCLRKDPDRRYNGTEKLSAAEEVSIDLQRAITTLQMYERNDVKKNVKSSEPILDSAVFVMEGDKIRRVNEPETAYDMFAKAGKQDVA